MDLGQCEKRVVAAIAAAAKSNLQDEVDFVARLSDLVNGIKLLATTATTMIEGAFRRPADRQDLAAQTEALMAALRATVSELRSLYQQTDNLEAARNVLLTKLKHLAQLSKAVITTVHFKLEGAPDLKTRTQVSLSPSLFARFSPLTPHIFTTKAGCYRCSGCEGGLDETEPHIHYDGRCFHNRCMTCSTCRAQVSANRFAIDEEGRPLCDNCTPRCHKCKLAVIGDGLNAFGRHYHSSMASLASRGTDSLSHVI